MRCSYKLMIKSIALTILFSLVCGMAEISVRAEDSLNIISETSSITPQDVEYAKSALFPQAIISSEEVIGVSDTSQITVGNGYRYLSSPSTMTIYYMNPATETKTSTTSVSPEAFGYVMNGLTYWWDCTVKLLYTN